MFMKRYKIKIKNPVMGVPITFLDKYCPKQFRIVDALNRYSLFDFEGKNKWIKEHHSHGCNINGNPVYFRVLIQQI